MDGLQYPHKQQRNLSNDTSAMNVVITGSEL